MMDAIVQSPIEDADRKAESFLNDMFKNQGPMVEKKVSAFMHRLLAGNSPEINKFGDAVYSQINNTVYNAVKSNDLNSLKADVAKIVTDEVAKADSKIWNGPAQAVLPDLLAEKVYESVQETMAKDMPQSMKMVELSRNLYKVIAENVMKQVRMGEAVRIKVDDSLPKTIKKTTENLLKLIRGQRVVIPNMNPNSIQTEGIVTRDDYDALPEDHLVKMLMKKISLMEVVYDDETYFAIDKATTPQELKKAEEQVVEKHKKIMRQVFAKDKKIVKSIVNAFAKMSQNAIIDVSKETKIDLSPLNQTIIALSANIAETNNGSVAQLEEQLNNLVDKTIDSFNSQTKNQMTEIAEKLSKALKSVVDKLIGVNFKVESMNDIEDSQFGKAIVHWIDTRFDPRNDADFISVYKQLQNMEPEKFDKLLDASSPKDLGMEIRDPFYILQNIRGLNEETIDQFHNVVSSYVANTTEHAKISDAVLKIVKDHKEWEKSDEAAHLTSAEKRQILKDKIEKFYSEEVEINYLYKTMMGKASYVNLGRKIKGEKNKAIFQHGGIRPALPDIKPLPDEGIKEAIEQNLATLQGMVQQYKSLIEAKSDPKVSQTEGLAEQIDSQANMLKNSIKLHSIIFTKGLMRPRHQDDVMKMINEWVKEEIREPEGDYANKLKDKLSEKCFNEYITNYPQELVEAIAKTAPALNTYNPKRTQMDEYVNQQVINMWGQLLTFVMMASNKAQVEFKIKEMTSDSEMAQVAQVLKDPEMKLQDPKTGEGFGLNSPKGIETLIGMLQDPANKNSTLKLFIEQAGLTDAAIDTFLSGPRPIKSVERVTGFVKQLNEYHEDSNLIQDVFEQFIESLSEKLPGDQINKLNFQQLVVIAKEYIKVVDNTFEAQGKKESKTLATYKHQLEEVINTFSMIPQEQLPQDSALEILLDFQDKVLAMQEAQTEEVIEGALTHIKLLNNRKMGMKIFADLVPAHSPQKAKVNKFLIQVDSAIKKIDKIRETLQAPILDRIEKEEKEQQADAAQEADGKVKVLNQEEMEAMLTQQAMYSIQTLVNALRSGDQVNAQGMMKQMIEAQNPVMDKQMVEMFEKSEDSLTRVAMAGIMLQKGYLDQLLQYVMKNALNENGTFNRELNMKDDQVMLMALQALIDGTKTPNPEFNQQTAEDLAAVFVAACDSENATPFMDAVMQGLMNAMVNQNEVVQNMLIKDIIMDKEVHSNARVLAIDILGRYENNYFYPVFEDIIMNADQLANNKYEKLYLMNVALKSITSFADRNHGMYDYNKVLERAKSLNLEQIVKEATAEIKAQKLDATMEKLRLNELEGVASEYQDKLQLLQDVLDGKPLPKPEMDPRLLAMLQKRKQQQAGEMQAA